jgi:hypothetical protein
MKSRIILFLRAILCVLVAWNAWAFSLGQITRIRNPRAALRVVPDEPIAFAVTADGILAKSLSDAVLRSRALELARLSLQAQALNPKALRIISFAATNQVEKPALRRIVLLAIQLSRRETAAHFWMIEDRVSKDDVAGALQYYDLALRSSLESGRLLFPKLVAAIEDAQVLAALVPLIKRNPPWLGSFLETAITTSKNPATVATLIERSGGWPNERAQSTLVNGLLNQLVSNRQFTAAKQHYRSLKSADLRLLRFPELSESSLSGRHGVFDWQAFGTASAGMNKSTESDRTATMALFAGPGDRSLVARKLLYLADGNYKLDVRFGATLMSKDASVTFGITCLRSSESLALWRSAPLSPGSNSHFDATISIPVLCEAQSLDIEMAGSQDQQGADLIVRSFALSPTQKPSADLRPPI